MIDPAKLIAEARRLADDIASGRVVTGREAYFDAAGAPCCAAGHLLSRCGVTAAGNHADPREELGARLSERIDRLVVAIFVASDQRRDVPKALREYAKALERRAPAEGKG